MPPQKESQAAKKARLAKQKKDEEQARAKVVKETANARAQANGQKPAPTTDRIPKKKKRNGVALSSASDSDSAKSNSAEDQREASDEDDTEVEDQTDLASGDPSCRVTNCGLGNALGTNCPRHKQAARDQAANGGNAPRERRKTKPEQLAETGDPSSTPTKQPARNAERKEKQRSNKLVESQVQQALTSTLAPYLEQFQSMLAENAARAVRPCSTGYVR